MSSIRNSLHRRTHKERSQLSHRSKLGILEKHKDYVLRARDFHSKQDRIRRLKQKASEKNKDEFHFGMVNQRTNEGIHIQDRGNVSMPIDMVKLLKTQDENYIRTMRTRGQKKIDKIKAQLTALADLICPSLSSGPDEEEEGLDATEIDILQQAGIFKGKQPVAARRRNHVIFVSNEEEVNKYIGSSSSNANPDVEMSEGESVDEDDLGWKMSSKANKRPTKEGGEGEESRMAELREEARITQSHRSRLLKELAARLTRDTQLRYAERELEMQRQLMGKGGNRKVRGAEKVEGDDDESEDEDEVDARKGRPADAPAQDKVYKPRVYKWRAERKR
ncbi:u3 small nucleolar RNA-associated protein 11 [Schizopora paradoxa]|uniref:U3 small nucleolar RNA-associated protein 11 n=1 Tax=Schizopora paradoxa TaxID=27342 RepID=A0A0H2S8F6_9AGAM|nr:u3 small nucleolar RNA-associated protein 11 [Schizopora paradoxa]